MGDKLQFEISTDDLDMGQHKLLNQMIKAEKAYVSAGIFEDSKAQQDDGEYVSYAMIGAVHEFGSTKRNIPERSWMRSTFDEKRQQYEELARELIGKIIDGKYKVMGAMMVFGEELSADFRQKITDIKQPPLADSTLAKKAYKVKGKNKKETQRMRERYVFEQEGNPLIDTGGMRNSVTWAAVVGGAKREPKEK